MDMHITYSSLRENLSSVMEKIEQDSIVCEVTRRGKEPLVMMTKSDYDSWMETLHLMSSPENHKRLKQSFKQAKQGKTHKYNPKTGEFIS